MEFSRYGLYCDNSKSLNKSGERFASIQDYKLAGSAIDEGTRFVKNDEGNFFYWGRREEGEWRLVASFRKLIFFRVELTSKTVF